MCNFVLADKSATYLRKRIFALFRRMNLDTSQNENRNRMEECLLVCIRTICDKHPSGVSLPCPIFEGVQALHGGLCKMRLHFFIYAKSYFNLHRRAKGALLL